jgi:hypothetical protein
LVPAPMVLQEPSDSLRALYDEDRHGSLQYEPLTVSIAETE